MRTCDPLEERIVVVWTVLPITLIRRFTAIAGCQNQLMRLESQVTQVLADMFHVLAGEGASQTHDKLSRQLMSALGV